MRRSQLGVSVALFTAVLLWAAAPSSGQAPEKAGKGADRPARMERAHWGLDLTDEQSAQMKEIRQKGEADRLELRKELIRAEHALKGEFLQDQPDAKKVREHVQQVGAVRTKLELQRAEERLAFRKILTPEQRDRLLARGGRGMGPGGASPRMEGRHAGRGGGRGDRRQDRDRRRLDCPRDSD